jgi:hypothetical protein
VVGGEVSRRGVRKKGKRVELRGVGLEEDRRTVEELVLRKKGVWFETLVLRETIARFEWNEGWSCDYGGWLCDYDTVRTLSKVVTNLLYYSLRINTIPY